MVGDPQRGTQIERWSVKRAKSEGRASPIFNSLISFPSVSPVGSKVGKDLVYMLFLFTEYYSPTEETKEKFKDDNPPPPNASVETTLRNNLASFYSLPPFARAPIYIGGLNP